MSDTLGNSLPAFGPELAVCGTIVGILLVRMLLPRWQSGAYYLTVFGTALALYLAISSFNADLLVHPRPLFTGLLMYDSFAIALRVLLLLFALLFVGFTRASGVPEPSDAAEFYVLMLGATLGMCLMVAANHVLLILLGVEMASVPSYVMAGSQRGRRAAARPP